MSNDVLNIGPRITALPVIHGSGDFALEVRRMMLSREFDCVAVPLPPSFRHDLERAIQCLPTATAVSQEEGRRFGTQWTPESDDRIDEEDDDDDDELEEYDSDARVLNYVPVDPCQAVIMALRIAMGEHIPRAYIDLETARFQPYGQVLPDPYALKQVPIEKFATALLPAIHRLPAGQPQERVAHMARELRRLEGRFRSVLFVCSVLDWPWVREAFVERHASEAEHDHLRETVIHSVDPATLVFLFGELPFITGLYERARAELEDDQNLSIDGVKELLMAARTSYRRDLKDRARSITPHLLSQCLKYVRNLSLIERRMTPDMYTIIIAAKQFAGDQYALHVAETLRQYPYGEEFGFERLSMGIDRARLPDGDIVEMVSRLPGPPLTWRGCELKRRPDPREARQWRIRWNPHAQCSWPPEDTIIENFRSHVFDRAREVMGADLVKTEKFTTSIKDGIDIRDTLRHWYEGDIYVKVLPPARGTLDCAVMLFDSPADPREYPWRTTWFAEHSEESTLAFYATDYGREPVGPGICVATYGGALFLYPPRAIPDIWNDRRLNFAETLEERLLAAACLHSDSPHIALLTHLPPGAGWRRLAKRFHKRWVHLPLSRFSDATVQQLRMVHVLNGKEVRSYASHFIRRA